MEKRSLRSLVFAASDKKRRGILGDKSGQVTIFIIIAIAVVVVVVGFFFISPRIGTSESLETFNEENPKGYIQSCLEDSLRETVELISVRGGSVEPEHFVLYEDEKIMYLCYTSEDYSTCVVQQPLLKRHIESEIVEEVRGDVESCFNSLEENYRAENYEVSLIPGEIAAELFPNQIILSMNYILTTTKGGTERFEDFSIVMNNNLYELADVANNILEWESTYGDSETTLYLNVHKNFKVEKKVGQNEAKIYIITDIDTGDKFQFASRSLPLPSGFGTVIPD